MKKLLIIILFSMAFLVHSKETNKNELNDIYETYDDFIHIKDINDSILSFIRGNKFIYYIRGHRGFFWSLAVQRDSSILLLSGNTRNPSHINIDTIRYKKSILLWGLDSLALYAPKMKPIKDDQYRPYYEQIILFSKDKRTLFDCKGIYRYKGENCEYFNKKLHELEYYMYWHSSSEEIKKLLPEPY